MLFIFTFILQISVYDFACTHVWGHHRMLLQLCLEIRPPPPRSPSQFPCNNKWQSAIKRVTPTPDWVNPYHESGNTIFKLMAVVLGIRPPICLIVGADFIFCHGEGGGVMISIFITWEFGGGVLGTAGVASFDGGCIRHQASYMSPGRSYFLFYLARGKGWRAWSPSLLLGTLRR